MTLRRSAQLSLTVLALGLGVSVLPMTARADEAAPKAPTALATFLPFQGVVGEAVGDDPLVPYAEQALTVLTYGVDVDPKAMSQFVSLRDRIATEAANRVGADPAAMIAAWAKADRAHQIALLVGVTQLGTPYRSYKRIPGKGFDCSGFTGWVWEQAGVMLPRSSRDQIRNVGDVAREAAQAGDLVYYPGHISMYLGVEQYILHSPQSGRSVEFSHVRRHSVRFGDPTA